MIRLLRKLRGKRATEPTKHTAAADVGNHTPSPSQIPREPSELEKKVEAALDKVRPALRRDGGDVEVVHVAGQSVKLRMVGHCAGCPSARMTLQFGIERVLREEVPEVRDIVASW